MVTRCKAVNTAGNPCSGQPLLLDGCCYWHSALTVEERAAARRRGGLNRSNAARAKKQLPAGVLTTDELRGVLGLTIAKVIRGDVEAGVGGAVASLARAYVAVTEAAGVETLQAEVAELRDMMSRRGLA